MAVTVLQDATAPALGVARALGDALRWRIIELLATEQLCVSHLAEELGAGQPLVRHHVQTLGEAGLVDAERYRYWTYYRLRPEALRGLAGHLDTLAGAAPTGMACRRAVDAPPAPPPAPPPPGMPARRAVDATSAPLPSRPARQGGSLMPFRDVPMDPP